MNKSLFLATCIVTIALPIATRGTATDPEADTVLQYTYDESGNRIKRAVKDSETKPFGITSLSDSTHYPIAVVSLNPTSDPVLVDLADDTLGWSVDKISLYNLEGTFIRSWRHFPNLSRQTCPPIRRNGICCMSTQKIPLNL